MNAGLVPHTFWVRFAVAFEAFPVVDAVFGFTVDRVSDFVFVVGKNSCNL